MSRVDAALRISEDADGGSAEGIPFQPGDVAPLSEFGHEEVERHVPDSPAETVEVPGPKRLDDADLQARLVTGTSIPFRSSSTASLERCCTRRRRRTTRKR